MSFLEGLVDKAKELVDSATGGATGGGEEGEGGSSNSSLFASLSGMAGKSSDEIKAKAEEMMGKVHEATDGQKLDLAGLMDKETLEKHAGGFLDNLKGMDGSSITGLFDKLKEKGTDLKDHMPALEGLVKSGDSEEAKKGALDALEGLVNSGSDKAGELTGTLAELVGKDKDSDLGKKASDMMAKLQEGGKLKVDDIPDSAKETLGKLGGVFGGLFGAAADDAGTDEHEAKKRKTEA